MASRTVTISFLASTGVHAALLGGLMAAGFQVGSTTPNRAQGGLQTTIDFAAIPPLTDQPLLSPPVREQPDVALTPQPLPVAIPVQEPVAAKPEVVEPPEVTLGIDDGRADSKNWIGFKDPTVFRAPRSTIDQAEVSLTPGNPSIASGAPGKPGPAGNPGMPGAPADASQPTPNQPITQPQPSKQAQPAPTQPPSPSAQATSAAPAASERKGDSAHESKAQEAVTPLSAAPGTKSPVVMDGSIFDAARPPIKIGASEATHAETGADASSRKAVEAQPEQIKGSPQASGNPNPSDAPKPRTPEVTQAAASPAVTTPALQSEPPSAASSGNQGNQGASGNNATGANITGDKPGEQDDREADASAIIDSIDVVPGRPAAAKGLRIQTSRPQWSMATKLTARPRNPAIRIVFGPTGRVTKADFVLGKSTGYPDVDQPLLNAIYRWTARGEAIDKLNPADSRSGVSVTVNIILN